MTDRQRLIEVAFPLRQASIDSVHEKNVRHGHISTLHIWPARRPLAACRAALIATLLADPGNDEERKVMLEKLGGKLVPVVKRKKLPDGRIEEKKDWETVGGILHWGRESGPDLEWFRQKIRDQYGGRPPRVLDPFAGGGAIPLEAMRLGCEVTAADINPVAWFILKCTLEYPQRLAGQKRPLPEFIRTNRKFMAEYFKAQGLKGAGLRTQLENLGEPDHALTLPGLKTKSVTFEADLAWHVRAWGHWVLEKARADLEKFYPVIDGKPTVAYLWARTVTCKNCRATIPLLKTRWLCKKDNKRVLLTMEPNKKRDGVVFGIETDVPQKGGNAAQKRESDKKIASGTMSRSGVWCPCCGKAGTVTMEMEDIRQEGIAGRLGTICTVVVVGGQDGKEYRLPTLKETKVATECASEVERIFKNVPFGIPNDPLPSKETLGFRVPLYGFDKWAKLFTSRQLIALGTLVTQTHRSHDEMHEAGYPEAWVEALRAYLGLAIDRVANRASTLCIWNMPAEKIEQTFARFALPILWDFAESNPLSDASGNYQGEIDWISLVCEHTFGAASEPMSRAIRQSAIVTANSGVDVVVTDPPYYDAIPYSDLMDFFYVWLRRTLHGASHEIDNAFHEPLSPKWNHDVGDGELIDDPSRFDGNAEISKRNYENGMARAFAACHQVLNPQGRLVIVFAHKQPDAWETLVSAIIRAGFIVDGSWPIQTERAGRMRATGSAALSSSVWLVCKKRPETARPGWDNKVLSEMHEKIQTKLRDFWDAGIRGPDFVWAATGPALEAYSQHPVVKKANEPGKVMEVDEFLRHVRRIVVDFVVGRVMQTGENEETGLDDVTTYYLLHRQDFGFADAPVGPCILYAVSCNLSDSELADRYDLLARTGGKTGSDDDEESAESGDGAEEEGTGSTVKLKTWNHRKRPSMGFDPVTDSPNARAARMQEQLPGLEQTAPGPSREIPLIDQAHRLMHLWKAGDVVKVDDYIDTRALRRNTVFHHLLQALIELAEPESDERSLLESISNHFGKIGEEKVVKKERREKQVDLFEGGRRKGDPR